MSNYWVDERTGLVKKCPEVYEDPEVSRLRKKKATKARIKRIIANKSRKRNR